MVLTILHGIALQLRQICDSDDYHPRLVGKQLQKVEMMSRNNARKKNTKRKGVSKVNFIKTFTQY